MLVYDGVRQFFSGCFFICDHEVFSFCLLLFQDISRREDSLSTLKAMREQAPSPQLERDINHLEKELESCSQERLCYEAQILRVSLLS